MIARFTIMMATAAALAACAEPAPESTVPVYETAPVETRPIEVTVDAAGVIEPETLVEVKSKA
jgi:multidrug efflux pump subunit AcrA (membrane-fusion protein)